MKFSTTFFRLLAVATVALATSAAQADLLTNGNFESGLTGWTIQTQTATAGAPGVGAQSGTGAAQLNSLSGNSVPELHQWVNTSAGSEFYFSGYMLTEAPIPTGPTFGLLKMVFRDGPGFTGTDLQVTTASLGTIVGPSNPGVESFQLNNSSPLNQWLFGQIQATAPVGTQSVGFLLLVVDFNNGPNHPMWFDNITASAVPEPGSLLALGATGLALVLRRRRNS